MASRLFIASRNILVGIIGKLITSFFPFLIRSLIIRYIGVEYLGVNGLFSSILSILSLSELGFGSAIIFCMYAPLANKDTEKVNALLNLYRTIYRLVGCVIILVGVCIIPFLDQFVSGEVPKGISLVTVYILFLGNTALSYFLGAYKTSLLAANQREDLNSFVNLIGNMTMYVIQLVFLVTTHDYMLYLIAMPIGTLLINISRSVVCKHFFPEYRCKGWIERSELRSIFKNVVSLFGSKISSIVMRTSDTILLSTLFGLNLVGIYSNYTYIIVVLDGFFYIFFNGLTASVGNKLVCESPESNRKVFLQINLAASIFSGTCCVCFIVLVQGFMSVWAGSDLLLPLPAIYSIGINIFLQKSFDSLNVYRSAQGLFWDDRFRPIIQSFAYVILNWIFISTFGANWLYVASNLTILLINFPMLGHLVFRNEFKCIRKQWILRLILNCVVVALLLLLFHVLSSLIVISSIWDFIINGILVGTFSFVVLFIISLTDNNFRMLVVRIIKRVRYKNFS